MLMNVCWKISVKMKVKYVKIQLAAMSVVVKTGSQKKIINVYQNQKVGDPVYFPAQI